MSQDPSHSSPSPSPTPSSSSHFGPSPSANLYLFTFLATLVVLVAISSIVVLRSYVLRRRYQRRVREALAAGIILTPRAQGSRKRRFGLRPKFHHVWVMPGQNDKWECIMPVSVHALSTRKPRRCNTNRPPPEPPQRPWPSLPVWAQSVVQPGSASSQPFEPAESGAQPTRTSDPPKMLQVSVLVAMPSPRSPHNTSTSSLTFGKSKSYDADADELPDFVIGVADLPCIPGAKVEGPIETI